ncbi:receptor-like protein 6 [Quercus suber]|uniref:Receptor-like protein 6 n=1 Tax=Quercus suber TaxID=58331 RepID=A0AAW0L9D1_QUESU
MFSMGKMNHQYLPLFLATFLFLISLSQTSSNTSSHHHCLPDQKISWLSNLVSLDLSLNYFIYSVGGDYYEKLLDLRRIDLEALVQNMTYLRELHLGDVNISSSLPQFLANLSSLTSLTLFDCNLQGEFPPNIFLLRRIQSIDLSYNRELIGFLPKIQFRSSLKKLHLRAINFSGEFPNSMDNLGSLNVLDLSETNLFGELPNSISNLKYLNYLDLSYTKISGELPSPISNLNSLNYLDLSSSNFSGTISPSIGNLSQLTHLSLSYNNFHGPIPAKIGRLSNLSYLDLSYNSFTEVIPSILFTILSLSTLYLDQNQLIVPLKFQNNSLSPLHNLGLSENKMSESILRSIVNFTKLQGLYLSSINLKGKVELNIFFELKELAALDLSGNKVFVSKANINSTLPKFSYLRLSSCNLSKFPAFLKAQNELQTLDLSKNNIEVTIRILSKLECNLKGHWLRQITIKDVVLMISKALNWCVNKYTEILRAVTKYFIINPNNYTIFDCFPLANEKIISHGLVTIDPKLIPN